MKSRKLLAIAASVGVALATLTGCLRPHQHTVVSITAVHPDKIGQDDVTFTFSQGLPAGATVQYTPTRPLGADGKPVGVDGVGFLKVDFAPAVATDVRGASTAAEALYPLVPFGTTNVLEIAKTLDTGSHLTYVIGLEMPGRPPTMVLNRNAPNIVLTVSALG